MSTRRRRREEHEEHENHERWLVTYADMVTLLMVLFIVMFSMSVVDEKKFNALRAGLAAGFGQSTSVLVGSESILEQPGVSAIEPVRADLFLQQPTTPADGRAARLARDEERRYRDALAEVARLTELMERLDAALRAEGLRGDVAAGIDERGLRVSLTSRHVVFENNRADLSARGRRVLDTISPVLRQVSDDLQIDGHTNQVPVKPKYFDTDWDLSAARAVTVLRHLNETGRVPGDRLSAAAFGREKPLLDPSRPGSQQVNKRVDIVVLSPLPEATRDLLDDVATTPRRGRS